MKYRPRLILFALLLAVAGCLDGAPGAKPAPVKTPDAVVLDRLAVAVESGEFSDSSQRFVKVAGKTLKAHGVKPPAGYDAALTPWLTNHKPTKEECDTLAAKLRGMK